MQYNAKINDEIDYITDDYEKLILKYNEIFKTAKLQIKSLEEKNIQEFLEVSEERERVFLNLQEFLSTYQNIKGTIEQKIKNKYLNPTEEKTIIKNLEEKQSNIVNLNDTLRSLDQDVKNLIQKEMKVLEVEIEKIHQGKKISNAYIPNVESTEGYFVDKKK